MSHFANEVIYEDIYFDILDQKLKDFINPEDMFTTNAVFDMVEVLVTKIKLPRKFLQMTVREFEESDPTITVEIIEDVIMPFVNTVIDRRFEAREVLV